LCAFAGSHIEADIKAGEVRSNDDALAVGVPVPADALSPADSDTRANTGGWNGGRIERPGSVVLDQFITTVVEEGAVISDGDKLLANGVRRHPGRGRDRECSDHATKIHFLADPREAHRRQAIVICFLHQQSDRDLHFPNVLGCFSFR